MKQVKLGGTMPTVLNAANEVAVAAFLDGKITFLQIEDLIEKALESHQSIEILVLQPFKKSIKRREPLYRDFYRKGGFKV